MGSAKVSNTQPHLPTMEEKKSIKNMLTKPLRALNQAFFQNKKKEKIKQKETRAEETKPNVTVDKIVENFHKLQIEKENEKNDELKHFSFKEIDEDEKELDNFSYKPVEEERKTERTDSQSSQDSGFSEKDELSKDELDDKVLHSLNNLKIEDKEDGTKKKKLQTVVVSRGPIRSRTDFGASAHPYALDESADSSFRQINQINKQTFSGGHVIFNAKNVPDTYTEVDAALKKVQQNVPQFPSNSQQQEDYWSLVQELIDEESHPSCPENAENILEDFIKNSDIQENFEQLQSFVPNDISEVSEPNPIEEFEQLTNYDQYDNLELTSIPDIHEDYIFNKDKVYSNIFPTPPRSENIPSPFSDSQTSFYPSNTSEYTLSPPQLSSPNSEYEKYQEIAQFDEQYPSCISEFNEKDSDCFEKDSDLEKDKKTRERNTSTSSMTMKQYKDLQKELSSSFAKKECCQVSRKSCKELFQEHVKKLKMEERKSLCLKVANLDLKTAYGVLHHILLSLSQSSDQEDLQYALFTLICERVLSHKPQLFVEDFGLSLLKSAALRCPQRPLLARYVVQCVRAALRAQPAPAPAQPQGKPSVFTEIDAQGDNLVIACARAGDACADVLAELVRREPDQPQLFAIHHGNTEGYSALHVACRQHSAASPALHTAHVLLTHAGADLWRGDVKGEDTALHLAVNSPTCDLKLIMLLFKHVDRKLWKKLAHLSNRSSVTPLEYARSATKSTTRHNYPQEVLEFLKKCR